MLIDEKVKEILTWVALVLMPAITTLWLALGPIWHLPYTEQIGATLTAATAFLGAILGVNAKSNKNKSDAAAVEKDAITTGKIDELISKINELENNNN